MALKLAKAINPSPAMLVISNPRRKSMAAKPKAKKTTAKKKPAKAAAVRKSNPTPAYKPKKKTTMRKVTRRSNPSLTSGLGATAAMAVNTVLGMTALGLVTPLVPQVLGPSPIGRAAQIGGLGWLGGYGLKRFGFSKAGEAVQLGGAVLGASILIESYVRPMIQGALRPSAAPAPQPARAGMSDIVTLPAGNYDPYYGTTPRIGAAQPTGGTSKGETLKGLLTMPAMPGVARY